MNDPKNTPPTNDESGLPTTPNAQSRAAYFEDMLPGVIASDERDGRMVQAGKRRRSGVPLTIDELRRDLKAVLSQLSLSFMQYEQGFSTFLRTPTHALDYAERVAAYAIKDYPRDFENDEHVAGQWDALNSIHVIGYAWRKGEDKTEGKILVGVVDQIANDALMGVYPKPRADETDKVSKVTEPTDGHASGAEQAAKIDRSIMETTRMKKVPKPGSAAPAEPSHEGVQAAPQVESAAPEIAALEPLDTDVGNTTVRSSGAVDPDVPQVMAATATATALDHQLDTDIGTTADKSIITIDHEAHIETAAPSPEMNETTAEAVTIDAAVEEKSPMLDEPESDKPDDTDKKADPVDTDDKIDFSW